MVSYTLSPQGTQEAQTSPQGGTSYSKRFNFDEDAWTPEKVLLNHFRNTSALEDKKKKKQEIEGNWLESVEGQEAEVNIAQMAWLTDKIEVHYTGEYLRIKRNDNLNKILFFLNEIVENFDNGLLKQMNTVLLQSQINEIYKVSLRRGQEIHYLSTVHIIENLFSNEIPSKQVLRETIKLFKGLLIKTQITFADYRMIAKRYFELGINILAIQDCVQENAD